MSLVTHSHECRDCRGDIDCKLSDLECDWAGGNDGCEYCATPLREATVDPKHVGWGSDPLKVVQGYLPANYSAEIRPALYDEPEVITIFGYDNAGWTLDDYVIPRLASGMIYATEVK